MIRLILERLRLAPDFRPPFPDFRPPLPYKDWLPAFYEQAQTGCPPSTGMHRLVSRRLRTWLDWSLAFYAYT